MQHLMDAETVFGAGPAAPGAEIDVVLEPLSRPELGEIRVDGVLAVGRNEPRLAACGDEVLALLSRRHARVFCEDGAAYVADLESRNGTTVNRAAVGKQPCRLRDGDEIGFGGVLSLRVRITPRAAKARPASAFTLTLTPERSTPGFDAIVVTRFPFLVGKADPAFARAPGAGGAQLGYLSRRHAHIFLKGGQAWIEDLASTNGTFVDGVRLQEHAVPLHEGELVAFGGDHFTYRVGIENEAPAAQAAPPRAEPAPAAPDKTTFIVAPTSFLEIFCAEAEAAPAATPTDLAPEPAAGRASPARGGVVAELVAAFSSDAQAAPAAQRWQFWRSWRAAHWGMALAGAAGVIVLASWLAGAFDPSIRELIDRGEPARAAALADQSLARNPDNAEVRALATEAALKAHVPAWLDKLAARDFDGARAVLGTLSTLGQRNPDLGLLVAELEWLGQWQQLLAARGGPDQPIRIYADEAQIGATIERWNRDTALHQRSLARIASYVPAFGAPYAEALTQLRKLQSEATVYLAAIERLKAAIDSELGRDRPEALEPMLKDYATRYPALGGLDSVRDDLARLLAIRDARIGKGRLFALLREARFATPPFQQAFAALRTGGQLPPAELVAQYGAATQLWIDGQAGAQAALQRIASGRWADTLTAELQRRQAVAAQFAALQGARGAPGHIDQLLALRETLDAAEDAHFVRATQAELAQQGDALAARAQQSLAQARTLWQAYRDGGAIEAAQRIESTISAPFRAKARLLAEAGRHAEQSARLHALVRDGTGPAGADPAAALGDEIRAETQLQRSALQDLRNVLEPELLRNKLALLGSTAP